MYNSHLHIHEVASRDRHAYQELRQALLVKDVWHGCQGNYAHLQALYNVQLSISIQHHHASVAANCVSIPTLSGSAYLLRADKMGSEGSDASSVMLDFLKRSNKGYAVIDGGLATELERHGANLNDPLWSAKCLIHSPELIRRVHLDYLEAGADIIITASYQATIQGFEAKGLSRQESEALLKKSVEIALEARNIYCGSHEACSCEGIENGGVHRSRTILVAASVGSYGAYLADGSEYSGDYGSKVTVSTLKEFHRRRVQVLAEAGADLIAFETTPNILEAQAYSELLEEENINIPAWFSFTSKDGVNVVSGDSLAECVSIADKCKKVLAVGINCTPPRFIHGLILSIKKVTSKPILVYPNSGETYDATRKEWVKSTGVSDEDFVAHVDIWREVGASLFGGCCRTTPNTIRAISKTLSRSSPSPSQSQTYH